MDMSGGGVFRSPRSGCTARSEIDNGRIRRCVLRAAHGGHNVVTDWTTDTRTSHGQRPTGGSTWNG